MSNSQFPSGNQDLEREIKDLSREIQLNPQDADLYALRSLYYAEKYDTEEAITDGEKAVALNPQTWHAYYARGRAYQVDDSLDMSQPIVSESGVKSIQDLTQSIRMNPTFGAAYGYRAQVYMHQGRLENAFADLKKALEYDPMNWGMSMQMLVNSLADDGYTTVEMFLPTGMPEYHKEVKTPITDWDHYLQWRLKRKAKRSKPQSSGRVITSKPQSSGRVMTRKQRWRLVALALLLTLVVIGTWAVLEFRG